MSPTLKFHFDNHLADLCIGQIMVFIVYPLFDFGKETGDGEQLKMLTIALSAKPRLSPETIAAVFDCDLTAIHGGTHVPFGNFRNK